MSYQRLLSIVGVALLFLGLTVLTQVGGLILLLALFASRLVGKAKWWHTLLLFIALYVFTTFVIIPPLASCFGRERVLHGDTVKPANRLTDLLNRNYVRPAMNKVLQSAAEELSKSNIKLQYLDANFPFIDGFPLLPHLSHNDGRKLDLAYIYLDAAGDGTEKLPSWSGYGIFIEPASGENNQTATCLAKGYWQYDFTQWIGWSTGDQELVAANGQNKELLNILLRQPATSKIFIEPHLKQRWKLIHPKLRYHGCQAVRHDDHLHLQIQ